LPIKSARRCLTLKSDKCAEWINWFWRTQQQKEIDYLEERDGKLAAYEFKWSPSANYKYPKQFLEAYPGSSFSVIHRENFEEFIV
jgi:hypothetical protein